MIWRRDGIGHFLPTFDHAAKSRRLNSTGTGT
jgi:hypothetical protein